MGYPRISKRLWLLVMVLLIQALHFTAAQRNITIPTPTSEIANNATAQASNRPGNATVSGNATISGSANNTNSSASRTSSTVPITRPLATQFTTQTQLAPGPASAGGGNVGQSPDDSFIASAERLFTVQLLSAICAVVLVACLTGRI